MGIMPRECRHGECGATLTGAGRETAPSSACRGRESAAESPWPEHECRWAVLVDVMPTTIPQATRRLREYDETVRSAAKQAMESAQLRWAAQSSSLHRPPN